MLKPQPSSLTHPCTPNLGQGNKPLSGEGVHIAQGAEPGGGQGMECHQAGEGWLLSSVLQVYVITSLCAFEGRVDPEQGEPSGNIQCKQRCF